MRIPLGVNLESRDGTVAKDARVVNGIVEVKGDGDLRVRKRPGLSDLGAVKVGTAQLLYAWNGINTIQGDYLNRGTIATIISAPTQTNLSPTVANLRWDAADTGSNAATPRMMIKDRTQAKTVNQAGTVSAVTYGGTMGLTVYNLVSLTRSGTVATGTTAQVVTFGVGDSVTIAGANQTDYNGAMTITGVTPGSFTPGATIPITISRVSTLATATTVSGNHGLVNGTTYTISGANETAYNGSYAVTVTSPTTFTYTVTVTGQGPDTDLPISSITRSGNTATATTATPHGLTTGWTITISGATQSGYNGSFAITVTSPTTFTYTPTVTTPTAIDAASTLVHTDETGSGGFTDTLSGGNLTVAFAAPANGSFNNLAVRGSTGKSSGLWKFEFTVNSNGALMFAGISKSGASLSYSSLTFGSSTGLYGGGSLAAGDVAGIVLDMDHLTVLCYKNGAFVSQSTITAGTYYPTIFPAMGSGSSASVTANFGGSSFVYSGYDQPKSPATGSPIINHTSPATPATGTIVVTRPSVTVNSTFTYTVANSPTTPATGTITATTNGGTVPGIPYIDGYFCVMDINGVIWNSASDDPTTWGALSFISAQAVNGGGKALARSLNYLIALKEWSTEYFYDAHNASGSPFSPVDNGFTLVGCASGDSVAQADGNLLWASQVRERGRAVHMMTGLQVQPVSTPDIERILGQDDLATVYAYGLKINGHPLYLLTLVTSDITLVYDLKSQIWGQWTSLTIGSSKSVSSITRSGTTATVTTATAHGLSDGDPVKISGANQNEYNTIFQARVISTTVFTIEVDGAPTTPATGTILAYPYTSSRFKFSKYADYQGLNLFLHESDGHLYQMVTTAYQDAGVPIDQSMRTVRLDGGNTEIKTMSRVIIVGDRVVDDGVNNLIMVRWSDDDYTTNSAYRPADLSLEQPMVRKCGAFRRRSIELRYTGNAAPVLQALELGVE